MSEKNWGRAGRTAAAPEANHIEIVLHCNNAIDWPMIQQAMADKAVIIRAGRQGEISDRLIKAYAKRRRHAESRTLRDSLHEIDIANEVVTWQRGLSSTAVLAQVERHLYGDRCTVVCGVLRELAAECENDSSRNTPPSTTIRKQDRRHPAICADEATVRSTGTVRPMAGRARR